MKKSKPTRDRAPKPEGTWVEIVRKSLASAEPQSLEALYALERVRTKARANRHVRAKIRQVLYKHPEIFVETEPGYWSLTAYYSPEQIEVLRQARAKRLRTRNKTASG